MRRLLIVLSLAIAIGVVHLVVRDLMTEPDGALGEFDQALRSAVDARLSGMIDGPIDLRDLTPFQWDEARFFPGNTTAEDIRRDLHAEWEEAPSSKRSEDEVVVFMQDGEPVGGYAIDRLGVETCLEAYSPVPASRARYVIASSKSTPDVRYLVAEALAVGEEEGKPFSCVDDIERSSGG